MFARFTLISIILQIIIFIMAPMKDWRKNYYQFNLRGRDHYLDWFDKPSCKYFYFSVAEKLLGITFLSARIYTLEICNTIHYLMLARCRNWIFLFTFAHYFLLQILQVLQNQGIHQISYYNFRRLSICYLFVWLS